MPGDRVVSKDSPLLIMLKDGSRITLAANSEIKFESTAGDPVANLTSGNMEVKLAAGSNARIMRGGILVDGRSGLVAPPGARPELLKPPPPTPVSAL